MLIVYTAVDRVYESPFPLYYETHAAEDVQIFASGPMSHIFTGVHEQAFIPHGMAYAACIGQDKSHCDNQNSSTSRHAFSFSVVLSNLVIALLMHLLP